MLASIERINTPENAFCDFAQGSLACCEMAFIRDSIREWGSRHSGGIMSGWGVTTCPGCRPYSQVKARASQVDFLERVKQ